MARRAGPSALPQAQAPSQPSAPVMLETTIIHIHNTQPEHLSPRIAHLALVQVNNRDKVERVGVVVVVGGGAHIHEGLDQTASHGRQVHCGPRQGRRQGAAGGSMPHESGCMLALAQ